MKKITLLITLFAFSFGFSQNGGDNCGSAVVIPTTAGTTNYTATTINQTSGGGEMGSPQPRDAAWFSFSPTIDGTIDVSSCGNPSSDTRLFIGEGTCGSLNVLFDSDNTEDQCDVNEEVNGIVVIAGNNYYIEWDDRWQSSTSDPFDWSFTYTPTPCGPPSNISIDFKTQTLVDFRWDIPAFGSPVGYDWEIVPTGDGQGNNIVVSGSVTETTASSGNILTQNTTYDIYVRTDCGMTDGTSSYIGPFTFTTKETAPPANDTCFNASSATIEGSTNTAGDATPVAGTILGACLTNTSDDLMDGQACFGGENSNDDVWYSFVANTTNVNITVDSGFDAVISLFSGDCSSLGSNESCADAVNGAGQEQISFSSLVMGETYYFRVYNYLEATPADPTFTYKLWSPDTLGNELFENENAFKLFPNPVNNVLNIQSRNTIDSVSIYNMLGQEVISIKTKSNKEEISMSDLKTGTYFAKITSNGVTETLRVLKR